MDASQIANVDYSLSGYDGLHLLLYHVTGQAGLTGITQSQAMKSGPKGKLGGAIYFADSAAVAKAKALAKGVTLVALVEVGRIMVLKDAWSGVTRNKLEKVGCNCIKCIYSNGAEYVIYNPSLVKVVWVTEGSPTGPRVLFPAVDPRPMCMFNGECIRKNPMHFADYKHSVPPKFPMRIPAEEQKPPCRNGAACKETDSRHFMRYSHPSSTPVPAQSYPQISYGLPPCKYGMRCIRTNPNHFKECSHPPGFRPMCWYKDECINRSAEHLRKYRHK